MKFLPLFHHIEYPGSFITGYIRAEKILFQYHIGHAAEYHE
jgi:hypothetical protein